jgi:uncharacterized protein
MSDGPTRPARRRKADLPRDGLGRLRAPGEPDAMAHLRGLADRLDGPEDAFARGAALFDAQRYFEAYVHFTAAWKLDRPAGYRGLAMVAGGLCHVQRGNLRGARTVIAKGREELRGTTPPGVDVPALLHRIDAVLDALDAGEEPGLPVLPVSRDGGRAP